jgi:CrcB protein
LPAGFVPLMASTPPGPATLGLGVEEKVWIRIAQSSSAPAFVEYLHRTLQQRCGPSCSAEVMGFAMAIDSAGSDPAQDRAREVIDPDVDLRDAAQVNETRVRKWDLLVAVAAGGLIGAEARYGVGLLLPYRVGQFPWATVLINASGCVLIGVLMVVLLELTTPHRLARPFLGVGILGGYTTFSTFAMDAEHLILAHRALLALAYVVLTMVLCAVAVWAATVLTRGVGRILLASAGRRTERSYR